MFYYSFYLLFFLNVSNLQAQTIQKEKQSLISILKILETRFGISFSYIDDTIKAKESMLPDSDLMLEEALELLKVDTQLDFELLDNRFVVIRKVVERQTSSFTPQRLEEVIISNYLTTGIMKFNDGSITIKP